MRRHHPLAVRPPRFVIAQTGRSGSSYTARILTAAGIHTGHEDWFRPYRRRIGGLDGDSSWCAAPHLRAFRGIVLHQVRDPLKVIRSLSQAPPTPRYQRLRSQVAGPPSGNPLVDALRYWVVFNRIAEQHAVLRWRLEDLDVAVVDAIGQIVGVPADLDAAGRAITETPDNVNAHYRGAGEVAWGDLPDCWWRDEAVSMAGRYGYAVPAS